MKALFLYNFAKFVTWPGDMPSDFICVGILGDDPFGEALDRAVRGKTVDGRAFVIRRLKSAAEGRQCHILFISASLQNRLPAVFEALQGAGVLTVGDRPGFAEGGGVIGFEIVDDKLHFAVNLAAAEHARVKISSKLLSLARIARSGSD